METLWRTGLVCTVIAIVFATGVEGGRRDEFVQSQGESKKSASPALVCPTVAHGYGVPPSPSRLRLGCGRPADLFKPAEKSLCVRNNAGLFMGL